MAQGNSRSAASGRRSEAVSRKRHDLRLFAANRNAATVYPFLGYLRAKCRRFAAVALRNAPAGAVPRTPFTRRGYAASVGGRAADGCPALPLRGIATTSIIRNAIFIRIGGTAGCLPGRALRKRSAVPERGTPAERRRRRPLPPPARPARSAASGTPWKR